MRNPILLAAVASVILWVGPSPARATGVCESPPAFYTASQVEIPDDSGIGGTGLGGGGDDSGTGGTGIYARNTERVPAGIYGTVTGFGSVCVNGLRIHLSDETEVTRNGMPSAEAAVAVGQVVWIDATPGEVAGEFSAQRVRVLSAVVGRVEAVAPRKRRLRIAGRWVEVPREALLDGAPGAISYRTGDRLDVHGLLRDDRDLVATRIDRIEVGEPEWLAPELSGLAASVPEGGALYLETWSSRPGPLFSDFSLDSGRVRLPTGRLWLATTRGQAGALTLSGAVRLERLSEELMPELPDANWEPAPPIPELPAPGSPLPDPGASPLPDTVDPLGDGLDRSAADGLRIPDARVVVPVSPEREISRDAPLRELRGR